MKEVVISQCTPFSIRDVQRSNPKAAVICSLWGLWDSLSEETAYLSFLQLIQHLWQLCAAPPLHSLTLRFLQARLGARDLLLVDVGADSCERAAPSQSIIMCREDTVSIPNASTRDLLVDLVLEYISTSARPSQPRANCTKALPRILRTRSGRSSRTLHFPR
eukprot:COSAG02_NODE_239_length_27693_cov_31.385700_15_plen_162_part_00